MADNKTGSGRRAASDLGGGSVHLPSHFPGQADPIKGRWNMATELPTNEPGVILTSKGKVVFRHFGRGPVERRLAMKRAFARASCDSLAVDPPKTEGGFHYPRFGHKGFRIKWNPDEWLRETGIRLPMDLGAVAASCEQCGYCPSQEIIEAGFTMDAALMVLRNFLFHRRQHEREQTHSGSGGVGPDAAEPQADTKEQPWADDAPEYLPLKEARKLIDNRLSLSTLSKLLVPDGEMRYMRKYGKTGRSTRCKVHIGDFHRYMQSHQNDPQWAKAYLDFREAVGKGDRRWFWQCKTCGHEYPENAKAPERCPKCKGEVELTPKAPPKPRK